LAGCAAIEFLGGPKIPFAFGRVDHADGSFCPVVGLLPDASQGAQHVRDVFYRMGFNDQEIVCLSGAHTLGRCHRVRSGYDGPWTRHPLKFDNMFFKNLLHLDWKIKEWDGPEQFVDVLTEELMMLPTDIALKTDAEFRKFVELYAGDEKKFFDDFANAYGKLISLGCPEQCDPFRAANQAQRTKPQQASIDFREAAMHGSVDVCRKLRDVADVHETEKSSGRTALHKAAFWGHDGTVEFLVSDCKLDLNAQDFSGDSALHDAARFGHLGVAEILLKAGADANLRNHEGKDVRDVATQYEKQAVIALLDKHHSRL